jgi:chemotaxis protein CheD
MQIKEIDSRLHVDLYPGEYFATTRAVTMHTLLGSCVSACLFDPVSKVVGMNHFLLGNRRYARHIPTLLSEAGRYGIHAMELLINEMMKHGAKRGRLKAKAFGGGAIYMNPDRKDNFFCVGNVNTLFIREFLQKEGIPLVAEDLGGEWPRIVYFLSEDYVVKVKRVGKTELPDLAGKERQFWLNSIERQEKAAVQPEVWK